MRRYLARFSSIPASMIFYGISNPPLTKLILDRLLPSTSPFLLPISPIILSFSSHPQSTPWLGRTLEFFLIYYEFFFLGLSAIVLFTPIAVPYEMVIRLAVTSGISIVSFPLELFFFVPPTTAFILPRCLLSLGCLLPTLFIMICADYGL